MTEFELLPPLQKAWYVEYWNFQPEFHHLAAANCVDGLADELADLQELAEEDEDFENLLYEWEEFVEEGNLSVLLEQSCDDGVMLPEEQVYLRVKDCPREMLASFETLLRHCPDYVLAYLALHHYLIVRMDRAERNGKPDWRPSDGPFSDPYWQGPAWKKASFVTRNYAR